MSELQRRASNRDRVLHALQTRGRVSNIDLMAIGGTRAGARVFELRKKFGYRIRTEHVKDGLYMFVYEGPPSAPVQVRLGL